MTVLRTIEMRTEDCPAGVLVRKYGGHVALVVNVERHADGWNVTTDRETPDLYGKRMSATHWVCGAWNPKETVYVFGPQTETWCDECGHDPARSNAPYAVFGTTRDNRSVTGHRNMSHDEAHRYAETLVRDYGWKRATVGIDSCG